MSLLPTSKHIDKLFNLVTSFVLLQAVRAVVHFGIADLLKSGPRTVSELAIITNTREDFLYRLLRFLANDGIFTEQSKQIFVNNEVSLLLCKDVPFSMAGYLGVDLLPNWLCLMFKKLEDSLSTGESAFHLANNGMSLWDYFRQEPAMEQLFSATMTGLSNAYSEVTLAEYDFLDAHVVADIGGAYGSLLTSVLRQHSHLQGILFDMPKVIENAKTVLASSDIAHRCQFKAGSFLEVVPSGVDVYILRYILHDWNDEACVKILQNCRKASPRSKIIVIERVVLPKDNNSFTLALDIQMMMIFNNAKERSESEYRALFETAGYELKRIRPTSSPFSIIEGV